MRTLKNTKILFLLILLFNFLIAADLDEKYDLAFRLYKDKEYAKSKELLNELADEKYSNIFIYFLLGRVNRALGVHDEAIKYLKKYKSYDITPQNDIATDINLAYEYLQANSNKEDAFKKAKSIVDELIQLEDLERIDEPLWKDIKHCYSIVYNNYAYYLLYKGVVDIRSINYYKNVINMFKKALAIKSDAAPIVNNLLNTYIKIIKIYHKNGDKKNVNTYIKYADNLIKKYGTDNPNEKLFATQKYFHNDIKNL